MTDQPQWAAQEPNVEQKIDDNAAKTESRPQKWGMSYDFYMLLLQQKYGWNYAWLEWTFFMFLSAEKLRVVPSLSEAWVCPNVWKKWQVLQSTKIITQWVLASSMCCMSLETPSTL